ncbi:MAG: hypothetical protein EDX89_10340 [Acidobacteria bacterium]|nr:MAG: hypothetical protein EDX89_10340 [Acidobacteriota bacterium]MCE7957939.1 hypothetical protein [Acidobacteria bacterium ACB2]
MAKKAGDRISDALDHIKRAFAGRGSSTDGDKAKGATWDWLEEHQDVKGISGLISIGGFRGLFKDEGKTELRQYQRAYLLIERTLGGRSDADVRGLKTHLETATGKAALASAESVKTDIRSVYYKWADKQKKKETPQIFGEPILAPSFQYASSLHRTNLAPAVKRASQLLTQAWIGLARVKMDTHEKKRFEYYFAKPMTDAALTKVKDVLKAVHDVVCARRITLYYRGDKAPTTLAKNDTPKWLRDQGANALGPDDSYGFVYADVQRPGEYHVFLGKDFFADASRHGKDSMSGVIIHEMTHLLKNTDDHAYGEADAHALVTGPNKAQALENADNYEYFVESFQSKVTTKFG